MVSRQYMFRGTLTDGHFLFKQKTEIISGFYLLCKAGGWRPHLLVVYEYEVSVVGVELDVAVVVRVGKRRLRRLRKVKRNQNVDNLIFLNEIT